MTSPTSEGLHENRFSLSGGVVGVFVATGLVCVAQLSLGRAFFPGLHTILDTGMFLLSGMLALLFWDLGVFTGQPSSKRIAIVFARTSLSECSHAFVSVEWTGPLAVITRASESLRPATWPPAAHLLAIGLACSIFLMRRGGSRIWTFALVLATLEAGLFVAFYWLPRYSAPGLGGISRPILVLVPLLWGVVGWACWKFRGSDRTLDPLLFLATVHVLSGVSMLYSRSPHDTQAMVAHIGRVAGYLALLLSLLKMVSQDITKRIHAERKLAHLNDELETRVGERTVELASANQSLQAEIEVRRQAEVKAQAQLEKLNLLQQITRAIGGREDLRSIYQIVLRTLEENLGFAFGCICDYDPPRNEVTVVHVGVSSQPLAFELALSEQAHIQIYANGLSRCVQGDLVYEPDIVEVNMPFPQKPSSAGLRALVIAPLLVESKVFGVFVAARRKPNSFSSAECEFLRQLSEHVALAAHQAQLHASLQEAYDDLRRTQQAIMQQSGCARSARWPAAWPMTSTTPSPSWPFTRNCCWKKSLHSLLRPANILK